MSDTHVEEWREGDPGVPPYRAMREESPFGEPTMAAAGPEYELARLRQANAQLQGQLVQLAKHFTFVIATMGGSIQVDDAGVAAMPADTHLKAEPNPVAHCTVFTAVVHVAQADGAVTEQKLAMSEQSVGRVAVPGEVRTKAGLILTRGGAT